MVGRYCIVGWKFHFNLYTLVLKVSIYTTSYTRQVSGAQKIPIYDTCKWNLYKWIYIIILPENIKQVFSAFAAHDPCCSVLSQS